MTNTKSASCNFIDFALDVNGLIVSQLAAAAQSKHVLLDFVHDGKALVSSELARCCPSSNPAIL